MDNTTLADDLEKDAKAFRENTVYTADGDPIRLGANADRIEAAAKALRTPSPAPVAVGGDVVERAVIVCPQCDGEGSYADGLDEAACSTDCTRCGSNGWIVDRAALAAMRQAPVKLDWRAIAKAAGEHGVRYRTNSALMAFFAQIGLTQPQPDAAVAVEQWHPIETAPRDGSKFLVWCPKSELSMMQANGPVNSETWSLTGPSWIAPEPTHWMPLPAPPAVIRAGGQAS